MTKVGLRDLKNRLAAYIKKVRAGETIIVTDRGVVVAELTPPTRAPNAALLEMARRGEIRLGKPIKDRKALYAPATPVLKGMTSQELLDWVRGEK